MKARTLVEIDEDYGKLDLPWVVQAWKAEDTGVDPLGLRQVNLDMMDRVMPGINNVTRHVRVYTLMTWAWWKAGKVLGENGERSIWSKEMREFVDRVDAVFSWSQFLLNPQATLPGSTVLPRRLKPEGEGVAYDFADEDWEKLRKSRRNSTDLLGAIQYGPSIRGAGGLRWLTASEDVFVPTSEVMSAIEEFDAIVSPHLPRCIKEPGWTTLTHRELQSIGSVWDYRAPTDRERQIFAQRFFGNQELERKEVQVGRRRPTLRLLLEALKSAGESCTVADVRARMFGVGMAPSPDQAIERARHGWRVLQIRQLQRLALEALYMAVETQLKMGPASTAAIVDNLVLDLRDADIEVDGSAQLMLDSALEPWGGDLDGAAFTLMNALEEKQDADRAGIPRVSVAAIACVLKLAAMESRSEAGLEFAENFEQDIDRLPLGLMQRRFAELGNVPALHALRELVEAWIFGQHLRWSLVRSGDGRQRLRVGLDEGGWTLLRAKPSATFRATPDRLRSALWLLADSGLIRSVGSDRWTSVP